MIECVFCVISGPDYAGIRRVDNYKVYKTYYYKFQLFSLGNLIKVDDSLSSHLFDVFSILNIFVLYNII